MGTSAEVGRETRVPWPGPRPYDEPDWQDFCGRDPELLDLLARVRTEKLTVLLGASGSGKTSLVRAGLVPILRQERYHPAGSQAEWPILLLRRWGNIGSGSLEENLLTQLGLAIDAIRKWGELLGQEKAIADAEQLHADFESAKDAGSGKTSLLELLEALARAQARRYAKGDAGPERSGNSAASGGLILIFDQFEEWLRVDRPTASDAAAPSEALGLIGKLCRSKAPTRVLLSMRREYSYALRELELAIGPLAGRSVFLEHLTEPTVIAVVEESSGKSDLPIDRDVAQRMVGWLAPGSGKAVMELREASGAGDAVEREEAGRPDLLQLQAALLEISRFVVGRGGSRVDMRLLDEFIGQFPERREDLGREPEGDREKGRARRVLGGALERWIEAALRGESRPRTSGSADSEMSRTHHAWAQKGLKEDLHLQVHRIAVRLAPHLSSGDQKVSQEENILFRKALGEEIARLGIKDPAQRSRIRVLEQDNGDPRLGEVGLSKEVPDEADRTLAGLARVMNWSPAETGDRIVTCFKETLHRLAEANILQRTSFGLDDERVYWELVHDQFGPNFTKWAERQRGTWDDCKSSLVVCSGLQPIAVPTTEIGPPVGVECYDLVKVSWQGCGIENDQSERLTLRNVRFSSCFLIGTIFDNIDFVGCSFEDCDLRGGLFRNCSFRRDASRKPTRFIRCDSNIAIVGGESGVIEDLEFRDCHLRQTTIVSKFEGKVRYSRGSRVIQGFYDVQNAEGLSRDHPCIIFESGCRACYCTADDETFQYLKFESSDTDMHNSALPAGFRIRS
jgi:AAA ATPase domain/Pentapeptide repeats (8 copies)